MRVVAVVPPLVRLVVDLADVVSAIERATVMGNPVQLVLPCALFARMGSTRDEKVNLRQ